MQMLLGPTLAPTCSHGAMMESNKRRTLVALVLGPAAASAAISGSPVRDAGCQLRAPNAIRCPMRSPKDGFDWQPGCAMNRRRLLALRGRFARCRACGNPRGAIAAWASWCCRCWPPQSPARGRAARPSGCPARSTLRSARWRSRVPKIRRNAAYAQVRDIRVRDGAQLRVASMNATAASSCVRSFLRAACRQQLGSRKALIKPGHPVRSIIPARLCPLSAHQWSYLPDVAQTILL